MNTQLNVIDAEQLEYLPAKTLLKLLERSQTAAKNNKLFRQTVEAMPGLFRRFEELDIDPGFSLENTWISISFAGDGQKLATVWRVLRQHGYNTTSHPKKGDTAFNAFWSRDGHADLFMMFSSSMCRRVQVGTKMVEQPVYETHCGDLPEMLEESAEGSPVVVASEVDDDIPF